MSGECFSFYRFADRINQIFTNASVCVSAAVGGGLIFTIILLDVIWHLKLLQCFFAEVVIRTLTWKNKGKTFWLMCLRYVSGTWKRLLLGSREKILEINSSDELFKILLHWNFMLRWILIWGFYFQHFFYLFPWIFLSSCRNCTEFSCCSWRDSICW